MEIMTITFSMRMSHTFYAHTIHWFFRDAKWTDTWIRLKTFSSVIMWFSKYSWTFYFKRTIFVREIFKTFIFNHEKSLSILFTFSPPTSAEKFLLINFRHILVKIYRLRNKNYQIWKTLSTNTEEKWFDRLSMYFSVKAFQSKSGKNISKLATHSHFYWHQIVDMSLVANSIS
jgi:hypothetical protein